MKKLTQKEIEHEREQADAAWNYVKKLYLSDYRGFETSIRIVSEMAEKVGLGAGLSRERYQQLRKDMAALVERL